MITCETLDPTEIDLFLPKHLRRFRTRGDFFQGNVKIIGFCLGRLGLNVWWRIAAENKAIECAKLSADPAGSRSGHSHVNRPPIIQWLGGISLCVATKKPYCII